MELAIILCPLLMAIKVAECWCLMTGIINVKSDNIS